MINDKVNINTKSIIKNGFECLKENGFILSENDVFLNSLEQNPTTMTAIAKKDNNDYTFKMNLDDNYFICVENTSFKYDMSKYKKDKSWIHESIKETEERINNRTSLEKIEYCRNNLLGIIALHNENPKKYPKSSIEREFDFMLTVAKEGNIKEINSIPELESLLPSKSLEKLKEIQWI